MKTCKDRNHPESSRIFRTQEKTHDALIALCFLMEKHVIKDKVKAQVHKQQKQQHL